MPAERLTLLRLYRADGSIEIVEIASLEDSLNTFREFPWKEEWQQVQPAKYPDTETAEPALEITDDAGFMIHVQVLADDSVSLWSGYPVLRKQFGLSPNDETAWSYAPGCSRADAELVFGLFFRREDEELSEFFARHAPPEPEDG